MPERNLPLALPVFPLTGTLLLPGNSLPLHIFEPRYRNLVEDVLAATGPDHGLIGMIQPRQPAPADNRGEPGDPSALPTLYTVGCAGRIHRAHSLPEGRYLILLIGLARFRVLGELPLGRGYRRVTASWDEFSDEGDLPDLGPAQQEALLSVLQRFSIQHGLDVEIDELRKIPLLQLVNGLAAALPFDPAEKQALLEADPCSERLNVLTALLSMGVHPVNEDDEPRLFN